MPDARRACEPAPPASATPEEVAPPSMGEILTWQEIAGKTPAEQLKTVLAGIGLLAVFFHGLRLLGRMQQS